MPSVCSARMALTGPARTRATVAVVIALLAGGLLAAHQMALGDYRDLEAVYVKSRQPSACVVRELATRIDPYKADPQLITDRLPKFLENAAGEVRTAKLNAEGVQVAPFPPLRSARRAVIDSTQKAVDLYKAMLVTPATSRDELQRFSASKVAAEERLHDARIWLLITPGEGWSTRDRCLEPSA